MARSVKREKQTDTSTDWLAGKQIILDEQDKANSHVKRHRSMKRYGQGSHYNESMYDRKERCKQHILTEAEAGLRERGGRGLSKFLFIAP